MFRKMTESLTGRVALLLMIGSTIVVIVTAIAVMRIFERTLDTQLNDHLTTYADILVGAIRTKDKSVEVDTSSALLKAIPRHWQIDTPGKHLAKSSLLKNWVPIPKTLSYKPQRFEITTRQKDIIIAVRQTFKFPNGQDVIITFGLEKHIADAYKNNLYSDFRGYVYITLATVSFIYLLIATVIIWFVHKPLGRVVRALEAVREGKSELIEGTYPTEITNLSDQINQLLNYTSKVIERHKTFSSNIAHALKTPLTAIRNETQSRVAKDRIDAMLHIIDRNLARIQTVGQVNILTKQISVEDVVERVTESFQKVYKTKITLEGDNRSVFRGDEADLFEIVGNLVENACKYSNQSVCVSFSNGNIIVEDDGPGIRPEDYKTIFERGISLDQSKPGSGIGLSITRDIVELYGGDLVLGQSELGGLRVQVMFQSL